MPCSLIVLMIVEDLLDEDRREAHRRLVEEEDLRRGHQRPADRQHLLLAARQGAGLLRLALAEPREQAVDPLEVGGDGRLVAAREGAHLEVLVDGHPARTRVGPRAPGRRPSRRSRAAGGWSIRSPRSRISPWRGLSRPEIVRRVVDLPAPFEPMRVTISPSSTVIETPRRAWIAP